MDSNFLHKVEPVDSFWNWKQHQSRKNNNINKWKFEDKRFSAPELFGTNRRKNGATEAFILGPGAGAGVGCGVGFGFGLVGGAGFSGGLWNHMHLAFGFGYGCGAGAGLGFGQGLGYGSSWKTIKSDVLGFEE
ncbi:hypothetical protein SOVF_119290 [Spinacia oleracea]|nr:hypothetical protein SOVF_119290 [Spinacia oleracea]